MQYMIQYMTQELNLLYQQFCQKNDLLFRRLICEVKWHEWNKPCFEMFI